MKDKNCHLSRSASCERPPCPPLSAGRWGNSSLLSHDDTASSLGLSPDEMTDDLEPLEVYRLVIYGFLLPFHLVHTSPIIRMRFRDMHSTRDLSSIYPLLEQQQVRKYFTPKPLFVSVLYSWAQPTNKCGTGVYAVLSLLQKSLASTDFWGESDIRVIKSSSNDYLSFFFLLGCVLKGFRDVLKPS